MWRFWKGWEREWEQEQLWAPRGRESRSLNVLHLITSLFGDTSKLYCVDRTVYLPCSFYEPFQVWLGAYVLYLTTSSFSFVVHKTSASAKFWINKNRRHVECDAHVCGARFHYTLHYHLSASLLVVMCVLCMYLLFACGRFGVSKTFSVAVGILYGQIINSRVMCALVVPTSTLLSRISGTWSDVHCVYWLSVQRHFGSRFFFFYYLVLNVNYHRHPTSDTSKY